MGDDREHVRAQPASPPADHAGLPGSNPDAAPARPLDILGALHGAVEELALISATTRSDRTRVAAITTKVVTHAQIVETLRTVGVLPNVFGALRLELERRRRPSDADWVISVIDEVNLPADVTDAMLGAPRPRAHLSANGCSAA